MYTRYFGLKENPFSIAPDPRFLYLSRRHQEALAHLIYGVTEGGGFVQLTGDVGTGKTMLIRALLERLPETVELALILYPLLSVHEFMRSICGELSIEYAKDATLKDMIDALNDHVLANFAKGRRTVLIIDEAQNLNRDVLEQLRLLTNLETSKEKLLQILLVGQPELNSLLAQEDMRQLAQRVTARYSLGPLGAKETSEYILHRCLVAGAKTPLFSAPAMRWVHTLSVGVPRVVNIICDRALLGTYARGKAYANVSLVRRAAGQVGHPVPRRFLPRPMALVAGAVVAGLVVIGWQFSPLFENDASESPQLAAVQSADTGSTDVSTGLSVIAADAEATSSSDQVAMVEPSTTTPAKADNDKMLEQILTGPNIYTDTESAFTQLFSRWGLIYADYKGSTGCTRARKAGLRCIFRSGTWNNLRQLNRPAVIELLDGSGQRHHVLVTALDDNQISVNFGGQEYDIPISEIDRYWYGQYLLLWKPLSSKQRVLRRGTRGEAVVWLRNILARYHGEPKLANGKDLLDRELETQVKAFQRDHKLKSDGVVGRLTLIQLNTYDPEKAAPVLWKGPDRKAS